ncbi:hypothetical protein GCM10007881_11810 [Mesorhizobium huakuii]|nr:hypothetical protein GCM10007881_11810 [Mesorhizobium huakuii]
MRARVDFADLGSIHPGDMRALGRMDGEDALRLQLAKRVTDRHAAEAELLGKVVLAQRGACPQRSVGYGFAQHVGDLLRHRLRPLDQAFRKSAQSMLPVTRYPA